jgi:hypothetical protein
MNKTSNSIHFVVCLATGSQPLPNRVLHRVRSTSAAFKLQYPVVSLKRSCSCLRLLPRLPVFPPVACFTRHLLRKLWPIQLAFFILCRMFSLTLFGNACPGKVIMRQFFPLLSTSQYISHSNRAVCSVCCVISFHCGRRWIECIGRCVARSELRHNSLVTVRAVKSWRICCEFGVDVRIFVGKHYV